MQRAAAFDVRFDVEHQLLHGGLVVPVADDLERLNHRDAGRHHGRELPAEYRDVRGVGLAATLGFLADWYAGPFDAVNLASHWQGGQFNVTVLTLPAWTLCSLAAGAFAGLLIGRVVAVHGELVA